MRAGTSPRAAGPEGEVFVLLVGCPAALVDACREEGHRLAIGARACDAASARAVAAGDRLFAVLVAEAAYQERPGELDALAREAGVALLRIDVADLGRPGGERLLAAAVLGAAASGDEGDGASW